MVNTEGKSELLTLKEAAELITISINTLYNWRSRGVLRKDKRYPKDYILDIREKWINGELIT